MHDATTPARRALGASGLQVAPLAFGGNVFGWTADEASSFRLLDTFVDAGFNLLDTADVYARWVPGNRGGESETIIGRWLALRGRRERVLIATKVGMDMGGGESGLSRAYILRAVERSLQRLQTDYIDLYQAHCDDTATPLEETLEAFDALVRSGKVRAIGASNYNAPRLAAALALSVRLGLAKYCCLQPHYNLYDRADFEAGLAALCRAEGLAVIPYFSLASGFLTGKYRSEADLAHRARGGGIKRMLDARGLRILAALDQVAREHAATPAQVALRWLLEQGVTAPIASATDVAQLQELLRAPALTLPAQDLEVLNRASAPDAAAA